MYEYQKREGRIKKVIIILILMLVVSASSIWVYSIYENIDINDYKIEDTDNIATRLSRKCR